MKKHILLILLSVFSLGTIQAEITWTLSDDGTLTISGTDMPNYHRELGEICTTPWYSQREKIKKIIIENGVTNIGTVAFFRCSNCTSIIIPNSVTSIGNDAFGYCSGLTSITIPNSVTSIGDWAFSECSGLTSITIPNSVTNIGGCAFGWCKGLTSITISNSIKSIGRQLFYSCISLVSIEIPNSVTSIGDAAFGYCSGLTSITIPNSVTSIGMSAFEDCSSLTSVTIPNSVTSIKAYAFVDCSSLTSITIPNSVTSIGKYAFSGCYGLTSIYCEATTPPNYVYDSFDGISHSTIPFYVPANSLNLYKSSVYYSRTFSNILPIQINTTLTLTDKNSDLTEGYYKKGKITLSRNNMYVGDYATFCLPFDIDLSKTTDVFSKVYVPSNIGLLKPSGTLLLLLDEVNNKTIIKAGQIFVAKCQKSEVVFENCADVSFEESTPNPSPLNLKVYNFDDISGAYMQNTDVKIKIGGTYSQLSNIDKNNYRALYANGSFGSTTSVTPFQMYVYIVGNSSLSSKIMSISFDFNNEATGIKELRTTNDNSPIYDLNGRMVIEKNLKPGLYIKQGKKIVIGSR